LGGEEKMTSRFIPIKVGAIVHQLAGVSNPLQNITWYQYQAQAVDDSGLKSVSYTSNVLPARIQPTSKDLIFSNNLEFGNIYKTFFILTDDVNVPDRNISVNGDYLGWNNLYWRVMKVEEEFNSGWSKIIAQQTDSLGE
jgi:hypothetical protein